MTGRQKLLLVCIAAATAVAGVVHYAGAAGVATFRMVIAGLSLASKDLASRHVTAISVIAAVAILFVYATWVWGYLRSDEPREETHASGSSLPLSVSVGLLAVSGVGAAFVSD